MNFDRLIKQAVKQEIENGGFSGGYQVSSMNRRPHAGGEIDLKTNIIKIEYNPLYEEISPGKLPIMAADITKHEINHRGYKGFNGCPRNLEFHVEKIFEPIGGFLEPLGYNTADAHYVSNALEDTILHLDLSNRFALNGIVEFFSDVGQSAGYTEFYDAHVRLNMLLWGNKKQKKALSKYFLKDKEKRDKVIEVIKNFMKRTGLASMGRDRIQLRNFLNNEQNWKNVASIYAEEFSKLMCPGYAIPLFNHSGKGTKGRENEISENSETEGNEFDKEMERENYKIKRVVNAHNSGKGVPPMMDSFEALDLFYQSLARKINLKVISYTQSDKKPIVYYGQRLFYPDRDDSRHLTFGFDDTGAIELRKRQHPVKIDIPYKISPRGIPQILFCICDTSGSMKLSPQNSQNTGRKNIIPWGDNSKYHFALLAWYALIEYSKQNHLLNQNSIGIANISSNTRVVYGLNQAKKEALTPQFGSTLISPANLKEMFRGKGNLIFTISDGQIENWDSIKTEFIQRAKNHSYFHLQIGSFSKENTPQMIIDLKNEGLPSLLITNASDLASKVIEITDECYRRR